MKIQEYSIKSLYPLALSEGEGVGTAYEYYAKRLRLGYWLKSENQLQRIIIAGLPEKYGSSLDFMLLASELGAALTIVDERPHALDKAAAALAQAQTVGSLTGLKPEFCLVNSLASMAELDGRFDLVLTSETVQRLSTEGQTQFIGRLRQLAPLVAVFAPNSENPAHTNQSGLSGLSLAELQQLIDQVREPDPEEANRFSIQSDYIDMPPFPPGITRTEAQRQQATSGRGEALAMRGLGYYARLERFTPLRWRRTHAHIVFAHLKDFQRNAHNSPT